MIINRLGTKLLNVFPHMVKPGSSGRITTAVVMTIVAVCLGLCYMMTKSIEPKFAFFVDGFELPSPQMVTVGEGSTVCFKGVKHDYLCITPNADGSYMWKVNEAYQDTLQYFKINDENPQKHIIRDDSKQKITINLSEQETISFSGSEIWDEWDDEFDEQQDILARHFAARYGFVHRSKTEEDSLRWVSYCNANDVRSFFERSKDGNSIVLVILDNKTFITEGDDTIGYIREGVTKSGDGSEQKNLCKIQFFDVNSHCYMDGETDNGTFQIDGVNYVMKATVKLTEWGAGHVMLERTNVGNVQVRYPRALGYVGTIDSLYENCSQTCHFFTLKQNTQTFPIGTDIYLPQLSAAISQDICNVQLSGRKDIYIHSNDNANDSVHVTTAKSSYLPFNIVPALNKLSLNSNGVTLMLRAGIVDSQFAWSYMLVPFTVGIVLLILILCPWSPVRINTDDVASYSYYSVSQLNRYPAYFAMLLVVAMVYCICKSLIALKLSYTYPYFEKMTGITPVTTSLMLLLFFTLAMVFNYKIIEAMEGDKDELFGDETTQHGKRKWVAWTITACLFAGIIWVFFNVLDNAVSESVIKSYFPSQIYNANVFRWRDIFGINDTHRSVPYTLMLLEGIVLIVWFAQNCYYQWEGVKEFFIDNMERAKDAVKVLWEEKVMGKVEWKKLGLFDKIKENGGEEIWNKVQNGNGGVVGKMLVLVRRNFIVCLSILIGLLFGAFFIDVLSKPLIVLAFLWAVLCLWDAFVLAVKALFPWHFVLLFSMVVIGPMLGNFGTAFITIGVIIGMCKALSGVEFIENDNYDEKSYDTRHIVFFEMLIISLVYIVCAMVADNGYMTNYIGFLLTVLCFYFIMDKNGKWLMQSDEDAERESKWVGLLIAFACVLLITLPTLCSKMFSTDEVNYSRMSRRIMLYSNFSDLQKSGYRYAESDAEFMTIMSHYMQNYEGKDPLSNEEHFLHPSVSTGQSPVVLNDLSVPIAFIGSYGVIRSSCVYFLLLIALLILVIQFSVGYETTDGWESYLTNAMQRRLLAVFMWVGTSFYIYMSYLGHIPFTGRLNPGFGVDAVGEALESAILLAFMAVVTVKTPKSQDNS